MNKYLLREFHALCEGGICQDFLTEAEKRMVNEEGAVFLTVLFSVLNRRTAMVGYILKAFLEEKCKIIKRLSMKIVLLVS